MPFGNLILIGLLGLLVAEAGVFLLVARAVGGFAALFALLATSILGGFLLARIGRKLAAAVAMAMARNDPTMMPVRPGGFMTVLGAMLLVLPGFITDLIGLLAAGPGNPAPDRRHAAGALDPALGRCGRPRPERMARHSRSAHRETARRQARAVTVAILVPVGGLC